jgi:peptidase M23-like protein
MTDFSQADETLRRTDWRRAGLVAGLCLGLSLMVACSSGSSKASRPATAPVGNAIGDAVTTQPPGAASGSVSVEVTRRVQYAWPALGMIASYFGLYSPNGIEIALDPAADAPVRASAGGQVTFAGGDACCDNGLYVVVDHGDSSSTLYGHLAQISVSKGDRVDQGDILGLGGSTGFSAGKRLHFELRQAEQPVDPLRFLGAEKSPYATDLASATCPATATAIEPASTVSLKFTSGDLSGYQVTRVSAGTTGSAYFPTIKADKTDALEVTLGVPAAPAATGTPIDFAVRVGLSKDGNEKTISCPLVLTTLATLPNQEPAPPAASPSPPFVPAPPPPDVAAPAVVPPPPTATRTPTVKPSPTATATVKPTNTATPKPATPSGTPGTPSPGGTPGKTVTPAVR